MVPRARPIAAALALLATACSGAAVDEAPEPVPASPAPVATTTAPASTTTAAAPAAEESEPAAGAAEGPEAEPAAGASEGSEAEPRTGRTPAVEPTDANGVGDSFYPLLGNGGYDVLHYEIKLDVGPRNNSIAAVTSITAQATEDLEAFNLDLSGLEVQSVTVDGNRVAFTRSGNELTVNPGSPLTGGSPFEVEIHYSGSPESLTDPGVPFFEVGWQRRDGVIYTASQPSGSMTWFPSNNHPTDKATFEIEITVPESLVAASNGLLASETTKNGKTTFVWRMNDPMATYLAAVYIGDFERIDHGPLYEGGPRLRDYVPADAAPEVAAALSVTPDVIEFLENLLGPYPFDAYGTAVTPFPLGFALENQTLSLHGPATLDPGTIAHEVAHQWLGNSVALQDWSDIWLNEGFATYLHLMFEAEHYGAGIDETMAAIHSQLVASDELPPKGIGVEELFGLTVYFRGAATLHALRRHAGDETFFRILRAHYERSAGTATDTAEFLGIVDEMAGPGAVDLVESWLHDETVPDPP